MPAAVPLEKRCKRCNLVKPLTNFYKNNFYKDKIYSQGYCKECNADYTKKWRALHPEPDINTSEYLERHRKNAKQWAIMHPEKVKERNRQNNRTVTSRFAIGKCRHKRRKKNLPWELTIEQYTELVSCNCTYCEGPLPEVGIGLDRIDNNRGYSVDNVVPCCEWCNIARSDHFTYEEMLNVMGPAIKVIRKNRGTQI